jgi:hypothetical protein
LTRDALGALVGAAILAGALVAAPLTLARFVDSATTDADFTTATLQPPTDVIGTGGTVASLTWTPSTSTRATGYELLRSATAGSGYGQVADITPIGTAATTDSPAVGTWYYVLRSYYQGWQSGPSNEAVIVISLPVTTPVTPCTSNAAETVNAGDNDGYEVNPGRGCVPDGSTATDNNSGTNTTNSCTSSAKDKHQFWGYGFALPGAVAAINGITVTPRLSQSNNGGTTWLCVQLSSDGGTTWTAPKQIVLASNALTTYTFGSGTDTWGRTWAAGDFGAGFRVRLINSSTQAQKDFRLDSVGVSVTYTP